MRELCTPLLGLDEHLRKKQENTYRGSSLQCWHLEIYYFWPGIIHHTTSPEICAAKHWPRDQLTLHQTTLKWNKEAIEGAVGEFEVSEGLKILLVLPQVFHYKILLKHKESQCDSSNGVKTPSPFCKTNKYFRYINLTGRKSYIRCVAGYRETIPINAFIMKCSNKACSADPTRNNQETPVIL